MKKIFLHIISFLISINVSHKVFAEKDSLSFKDKFSYHGYVKYLHQVVFTNSSDLLTNNFIHSRINLKYDFNPALRARIEIRSRFFYGEFVKNVSDFSSLLENNNQTIDISALWLNEKSYVFHSIVDRMSLGYSKGKWDITIGRQRINWGINTVWTRNDIFNTYNFFDFDYEERPGSDAVRIQYFISGFSGLDFAFRPGKKKEEHIGALLYRFNRKKYDVQLMAGISGNDYVFGGGWAGNLRSSGFKGEISYFVPGLYNKSGVDVLSASITSDYVFPNGIYIMGSILYNSNGGDSLPLLTDFTYGSLSAKNLMPFIYTGFVQVSKSFTPLLNGGISLIYSPSSNTTIVFPTLSLSMAQNWELSIVNQSIFSMIGERYESLGNSVFLRIRYSY